MNRLFVFIILFIFSSCGYKVTQRTFTGVVINTSAGFLNGTLEAYQADRTVFEKSFGADKYGYFGSESWRNKYKNGNPDDGYKSELHKLYPMDFDHNAATINRLGLMSGSILIVSEPKNYYTVNVYDGYRISKVKSKKKFGHYALDFLITSASFSIGSYMGYNFIRP